MNLTLTNYSPNSTSRFKSDKPVPASVQSQPVADQFHHQNKVRFGGVNEDLYKALKKRHKVLATQLVQNSNANINMFTPSGETFLTLAVQRKDQEGIQFVHKLGADINQADKDGWTPLGLAVANGQKEIVRLLHRLNADLNTEACPGHTPLSLAVAQGNGSMVKLLLDEMQADLTASNKKGQTPLTVGAATGQVKTMDMLLDHADTKELELIDAQDKQGWTPLTMAATKNQLPVIKQLHARGAKLKLPHAEGQTPLECAIHKGHTQAAELIESLLKTEEGNEKRDSKEPEIESKKPEPSNQQHDIPDDVSFVSIVPSSFDLGPDNASEILSREELKSGRKEQNVTHKADKKSAHNPLVNQLPTVPERIDEQEGMMDDASFVSSIPSDFDPGPDNASEIMPEFRRQPQKEDSAGLFGHNVPHRKKEKQPGNPFSKDHLPTVSEDLQEQESQDFVSPLPGQNDSWLKVPVRTDLYAHNKRAGSIISDSSTVSSITGYRSGSSPLADDLPYLFVDPQKRIEEYFSQESERGAHPLIDAAVEGNLGQVRKLVSTQRFLVNDTTDAGATALQWAASLGRTSIVEYLLNEVPEIDVNKPNANGHTPLIMAAAYNHPETVAALMKSPHTDLNLRDLKGNVNNPDAMYNRGLNPLLVACRSGNTDVVKELMKSPHLDFNIQELWGHETPLIYAVRGNHYEIAKALLSNYKGKIQINHRNNAGNSALMIAAENGFKRLTKLLLAQDGIEVGQPEGAVMRDTALIRAAQGGDRSLYALERLLKLPGRPLNARGVDGKTALAHASEKDHEKTVQKLLAEPDVEPAIETMDGDNALTLASLGARDEIIRQLLATGKFDVNHKNQVGNTALHHAASKNNLPVIDLLLADPDIKPGLTNKKKGSQSSRTAAQVAEAQGWKEAAAKIKASEKPFWSLKK